MRVVMPIVLLVAACGSDRRPLTPHPSSGSASVAVSSPPPRAKPTADAGHAPRCVPPPPDMGCDFSDECNRFDKRINGERAEAFWSGFMAVCSCTKLSESAVTAPLVVRELGESWKIVVAECRHDDGRFEAGTYLRESAGRAMPFLGERAAQVRSIDEFFVKYAQSRTDRAATAFANRLRSRLAELRGARWVYFSDAPNDGGEPNVTSYLVGFTKSGYLTGLYVDGELW